MLVSDDENNDAGADHSTDGSAGNDDGDGDDVIEEAWTSNHLAWAKVSVIVVWLF